MTLTRAILIAAVSLVARGLEGQWQLQESGTQAEFRGLQAVNDTVAWAAGQRGVFTRTVDGGATWHADSVPGASGLFFIALHAWDASRAVLLGTAFGGTPAARVFVTGDGGKTWKQTYANDHPKVFFDGMAFWDEMHGMAFGDQIDGKIPMILTEDGGASWSEVPKETIPDALPGEGAFAASGTNITVRGARDVWIGTGSAARARVYHSGDRGKSWEVYDTPVSAGASKGLFGIAFRDTQRGLAVGGDFAKADDSTDNLLLSTDGGKNWRPAGHPGLPGSQWGVAYVEGGTYVSVSPKGSSISYDDGHTWARLDGPGFNTASFAGALTAGWAAGAKGVIARFRRK